jgi:hypothetical protein
LSGAPSGRPIVNEAGENAFSLLLNEHHQMFAEAGLVAGDSQAARDAMIENATRVAMQALNQQLARVAPCAGGEPSRARAVCFKETVT